MVLTSGLDGSDGRERPRTEGRHHGHGNAPESNGCTAYIDRENYR